MNTKTLFVFVVCLLGLAYSDVLIKASQSLTASAMNIIGGVTSKDAYGYTVTARGDVNGDGVIDLLIGAWPGTSSTDAGAVYVVYGTKGGFQVDGVYPSTTSTSLGYKVTCGTATGANSDGTGSVIAYLGDVNGDTVGDFAIGAPLPSSATGTVYVIYGVSGTGQTTVAAGVAASFPASVGYKIVGKTGILFGSAIVNIGDPATNGVNNFAVSAPNGGSATSSGAIYVIIGQKASTRTTLDYTSNAPTATDAYLIQDSTANDKFGTSITAVDLNGDKMLDIVGATVATVGKVYVVFGTTTQSFSGNVNSMASATVGITITGKASTNFGVIMRGLDDINGDGINDLAIGDRGESCVNIIYGKSTGWANIDLTTASFPFASGYKICAAATETNFPWSLSNSLDVNGDNIRDIIIGNARTVADTTGYVYVVYGKKTNPTAHFTISSTTLIPETGFSIQDDTAVASQTATAVAGVNGDAFGYSIAVGDIDADGFPELLVGAPGMAHGNTLTTPGVVVAYHFSCTIVGCLQCFNNMCSNCASGYAMDPTGTKCFVPTAPTVSVKLSQSYPASSVNIFGGGSNNQGFGSALARGDINNDGIDDLLVGSYYATSTPTYITTVAVIYGVNGTNYPADVVYPASLSQGFTITGTTAIPIGKSVAVLADVNNDKVNDIAIGSTAGGVYVIFGKNGTQGTNVDISTVSSTAVNVIGFKATGPASLATSANQIVSLGDVNNDKYNDFAVAAPGANSGKGYVWVMYGSPTIANIDFTSNPTAGKGYTISDTTASDALGTTISTSDVNGDGINDVIATTSSTSAYIVFGSTTATDTVVNTMTASAGMSITNIPKGGIVSQPLGDINGDKIGDVAIMSYSSATGRRYSGVTYVFYGSKTGLTSVDLSKAWSATYGFRIYGAANYDNLYQYLINAGDVNGDGVNDIAISTYLNNQGTGNVYIIYGRTGLLPTDIDLSGGLGPTVGFVIQNDVNGAAPANSLTFTFASDLFGYSLVAGDFNKDGFPDLAIASPQRTHGSQTYPGAVTVYHFNYVTDGCLQGFNSSCLYCASGYTYSAKTGTCYVPSAETTYLSFIVFDGLSSSTLLPVTVSSGGKVINTLTSAISFPVTSKSNVTTTYSGFETPYSTGGSLQVAFRSGLPIGTGWSLETLASNDTMTLVLPTGGKNVRVEYFSMSLWASYAYAENKIFLSAGNYTSTYSFDSDDSCGTYMFDKSNSLAYVLVTGETDCVLIVRQVRGVEGSVEFNVDPSVVVANGYYVTFFTKLCSALKLSASCARVLSMVPGSTIINFVVDSPNQAVNNTSDDDLDALLDAISSAIGTISIPGVTVTSSALSVSTADSYHPDSSTSSTSSKKKTLILILVLSIVLGTLFAIFVFVIITRYFKNRGNSNSGSKDNRVTPVYDNYAKQQQQGGLPPGANMYNQGNAANRPRQGR